MKTLFDEYTQKGDISTLLKGDIFILRLHLVDSYLKIWTDIKNTLTGSPKANYSRNMGPYLWQKKGSNKAMTHAGKMFGLTGSSLDPALAIQNFQSYRAIALAK